MVAGGGEGPHFSKKDSSKIIALPLQEQSLPLPSAAQLSGKACEDSDLTVVITIVRSCQ